MNIRNALKWAITYLKRINIESAQVEAEIILEEVLKLKKIEFYLDPYKSMPTEAWIRFRNLISRRAGMEPLAYIIGKKKFMNWEFKVSPYVLIPRCETELLVEKVAGLGQSNPIIVDIGTGSGVIVISLIKMLGDAGNCTGFGIDISKKALKIAKENAIHLGVEKDITFLNGSFFAPLKDLGLENRIDIVVSNPPYVATNQFDTLSDEILWEPREALDGGEQGLDFYNEIIQESVNYLKNGGYLALEIGIDQANAVKEMILSSQEFSNIWIEKDYNQIERVMLAKKGG